MSCFSGCHSDLAAHYNICTQLVNMWLSTASWLLLYSNLVTPIAAGKFSSLMSSPTPTVSHQSLFPLPHPASKPIARIKSWHYLAVEVLNILIKERDYIPKGVHSLIIQDLMLNLWEVVPTAARMVFGSLEKTMACTKSTRNVRTLVADGEKKRRLKKRHTFYWKYYEKLENPLGNCLTDGLRRRLKTISNVLVQGSQHHEKLSSGFFTVRVAF